jgi:hypothetical protein
MAGPHSLVLVIVAFVRGVPVPVVDIVDMVTMLHSVMTAARLVSVAVIIVGYVGQRVLVVVALVGGVRVTVVYVVGVSIVLDAGMPAARTVVMRVLGMDLVHVRSHHSSVRILTWLPAGRTSAQPVAMASGPRGNSAVRAAEPHGPARSSEDCSSRGSAQARGQADRLCRWNCATSSVPAAHTTGQNFDHLVRTELHSRREMTTCGVSVAV